MNAAVALLHRSTSKVCNDVAGHRGGWLVPLMPFRKRAVSLTACSLALIVSTAVAVAVPVGASVSVADGVAPGALPTLFSQVLVILASPSAFGPALSGLLPAAEPITLVALGVTLITVARLARRHLSARPSV